MTIINLLSDNWAIAFDDEMNGTPSGTRAGMRMLYRPSGADTTVRTTNDIYSAVASATDDFQAMGFKNPMLPVTPNAYTMENNYFIPRRDIEYLKEGAITADWTVTSGDGVYRKTYTDTTPFVDGDIGRQVLEVASGDTGTLLDFEVDPDGTILYLWIRPDTSSDTFASTSGVIECTTDGGTGSGVAAVAATSGESEYAAIQAIGSVPTATEVYLYQNRLKMTDYAGAFQWWATDSNLALGIISILVRTKVVDTTIAGGDVEVFARRYTSAYDNFRLNVSAGGFSALPLASAPDINNTTGYGLQTTIDSSGATVFEVGEICNEAVSGASIVLTAVGGTETNPILEYYNVGDETIDLFSSGAQTLTGASSGGTVTTKATEINPGGPTEVGAGNGASVTVTIGGFNVDHDGDASTEPYSIQVNAQNDVPIAQVYERLKYITRRGATADMVSGMNVPGEAYRGLDAIIEYDTPTGTLVEGDDINNNNTAAKTWTSRLLHQNTGNSPTYITVTDQQTSIDVLAENDDVRDEGNSNLVLIANTTIGISTIASVKSAPFGTFTGTQIFGARGVSYINFEPINDLKAYILTDDLGVLRTPPNTVSFIVSNAVVGDRILVARDDGTAGIINKNPFGLLDTPATIYNGLGDSAIKVSGTIDTETAQSGWVRVIENTLLEEHKYKYSDRTAVSTGVFTLVDPNVGSAITTGGQSDTLLIDSTATFDTVPKVEVGMLVRNTFAGKEFHVWEVVSVDSDTQLTVRKLYGPLDATQDWDTSDTYTINDLIGDHTTTTPADYATTDGVFDLVIDDEVITGTTFSNSFVKITSSDYTVVINVRQGQVILPFTQNPTVNDGGGSATVVRTPDSIATP